MPATPPPGRYTPTTHRAPGSRPQHQHPTKSLRNDPDLQVRPWVDPLLDNVGHDPRSPYFERFWLPVIGPSATLLMRRLVSELDDSPDGFTLTPLLWAERLGLGAMRGGAHGPFGRALSRTCYFRFAIRHDEALLVHRRVPPLTSGQLNHLPNHLQRDHNRWTVRQQANLRRKTITHWSDRHGTDRHATNRHDSGCCRSVPSCDRV